MITSATDLDPVDDFVHEPQRDVDRWTENIQWNVRDDAGLGVIWHLGTMLTDPRLWHIVVAVTLPDGEVYSTKIVGPGDGDFGTSHAKLSTIDAYRRWRFSYLGGMLHVTDTARAVSLIADDGHIPVEIDLDLTAVFPVWVPEGSASHPEWGWFHHEQAVRVDGTVRIDGQSHPLTGIGHRDHSMGPRDMGPLRRAFWGNGIFSSGWGFATMQGEYLDDDFQRAAVFRPEGFRLATMTDWSRLANAAGDPMTIALEMNVDGEGPMTIEGKVRSGMNFTVVNGAEFCMGTDLAHDDRYMLTNLFVDWTCAGERGIGYLDRGALIGLLERGERT
jgi:hypothetical protein